MANVRERSLDTNTFSSDIYAEEQPDDGTVDPSEVPLLLFLVPGIRTDKLWAHHLRGATKVWPQRKIEVKIAGSGRISSAHLIFRVGLQAFRSEIKNQVIDTSQKFPDHKISFICHSMGSSLFSEIVSEVHASPDPTKEGSTIGSRIENILFLGSICKRSKSREMSMSCATFVNDVGTKDILPWVASTVNPFKYNDVGRFGFGNSYTTDRFFKNNHKSCTSEEHLTEHALPFLSGGYMSEPVPPRTSIHLTRYTYLRRVIWASPIVYFLVSHLLF